MNQMPISDPLMKDYEYFFPSISWKKDEIIPLITETNYNTTTSNQDIDINIPDD